MALAREIIPCAGKRIVIEPDGEIKYQQRGPLPGPVWIKAAPRFFSRDLRRRAERISACRRVEDGSSSVGSLSPGI